MAYIAPIHRASSIRNALRIRLHGDEDSLVLAKANRLEIWDVNPEGMSMAHSTVVYGTIVMLQRLRPKDSEADLLFIGTDRFEYFTAEWDPKSKKLETVQVFSDAGEGHMRESQSMNKCLVDPKGRFLAMLLWEGVVSVMGLLLRKPMLKKLDDLGQVRITELIIKGATFVPIDSADTIIAYLYQSQSNLEDAQLSMYRLTSDDGARTASKFDPEKDRLMHMEIKDKFARILIPVSVVTESDARRYNSRRPDRSKARLGGLIVVGETLLIYIDSLTKATTSLTLQEPRIFVAWAEYDVSRYFLADDYGGLHLLTLQTDGVFVTGMDVAPIGFASRASALVYMGSGMLFVASHHGDSQLARIDIESRTLTLVQTLPSISPILDFAIMDMGNREGDTQLGNEFSSGQARIVAGCGAFKNGSLRSIRSAVHLEDIGILDDFADVRGLFTLRAYGSQKHEAMAVSFLTDTRVFRFDADGSIEEVYSYQGLALDQPTLLARNLATGRLLQITPASVTLLDSESGVILSVWQAPTSTTITSASANDRWALVSIDGTALVSLNLLEDLAARQQITGKDNQVACLHVAHHPQNVGVVGLWSGSVSIINLATLDAFHSENLRQTEDSVSTPRDIVLTQLHPQEQSGPTLLVALEDGNVVTFDVSPLNHSLSGRKSVILGRRHANLHVLPRGEGMCNVFATTEQSSLIYSDHGRIIYSAALADGATYISPFDSEAYPLAIILATESQIRISTIDTERRAHVQPLLMGETVRRIAYAPGLKVFGLGCIKRELIGNEEVVTSSFKLVDEIGFEAIGKPFMLDCAGSVEMVESVFRAELFDSAGQLAERFLVGTSFIADPQVGQGEALGGRILVLGVDSDRNPYLIGSRTLKGACRCLRVMDGKIVAALLKSVVVYSYSEDSTTSAKMQIMAKYIPATFPVDIDINGSIIGITDLMQSSTLVEYVPPKDGKTAKLEERARYMHHSWGTAICHLGDHSWLQSDAQGNLLVLRRNPDAPTEEDKKQLQMTSEFNLGEQVNAIRRVHVAPSKNAILVPKAFLGTVEGSLYVYADIAPQYMDLLMGFQSRLGDFIKPWCVGELEHKPWRAYRTARRSSEEPFRFLDGELLERFLDLDDLRQEEVCVGLGPGVEYMRNMVEEMKRMH